MILQCLIDEKCLLTSTYFALKTFSTDTMYKTLANFNEKNGWKNKYERETQVVVAKNAAKQDYTSLKSWGRGGGIKLC